MKKSLVPFTKIIEERRKHILSNIKRYMAAHEFEDDCDWTEKNFFRCIIKDMIDEEKAPENPSTREFYDLLFPVTDKKVWYRFFCQEPKENLVASFGLHDKEKFINALMLLSEQQLNVYYSPALYKQAKHCAENADRVFCLIADIDDTGIFSPLESTKEEIIAFLKNTYHINEQDLPYYALCSGRGLHLIWVLKQEISGEKFKELQGNLATNLKADLKCVSPAHVFRAPESWNVKAMPRKSKLHKLNPEKADIATNVLFHATQEEIDAYKAACSTKKEKSTPNQKGKTAKKKNGKKKPKATNPSVIKTVPIKENKQTLLNLSHYTPGQHDINLIKDLTKYYDRRNGQIAGMRNTFLFILCNYFSQHFSIDECYEYCEHFIDDDFRQEAEKIIEKAYSPNTIFYKYKYEKIAELLEFNATDFNESYCAFNEERRKLATAERVRRCRQKKSQALRERKLENYAIIESNMQLPAEKLADVLGISPRTVYRIKKSIKQTAKM